MNKQNKKKLGYKQYETLLAQAHKKLDFLAHRFQELQAYFISYVEFRGDNIQFNDWMNKNLEKARAEQENTNNQPNKEEKISEKV